ncbi:MULTISPECIES: hypothetical protein [unclassified Saccharibacter]|uniref:hypothetical protein n=1 Tax=unclassified Saccharibacter TaxID=2648722 RepID=UPI001326462A|nr:MULTISPECIES: hypothetical protein [unclassified Saccharibacter]MXV35825.1 hypothetical protein [Saccharibacter sp. EH611]MXV57946.1 hypothetical protein [Saccharibacter sp. EH70]MXV66341.1 hypothetical protein [Saccharibacter sp. EH60]
MSLPRKIAEERRWRVLDFLEMAPGHSLNDEILRTMFREAGFPIDVTSLDDDLGHLERHHCVMLTRYVLDRGRYLTVVKLTIEGQQTWQCERRVPGVVARRPL